MTPAELDRLAHHATLERPDWPLRSVRTYLADKQVARPYLDVLLEVMYVAADPATQTPKRIEEAGPWKQILRPANTPVADRLPSSTPWALCDRCGFGHAAGEACQRKASRETAAKALAAMAAMLATSRGKYVPAPLGQPEDYERSA